MTGTSLISCLVVDDHELLRFGIARALAEESDMQVVGSTGDAGAVHGLVERRRPDVVVLDLVMPGVDGMQLCGAIASMPGAPAVVVYTGLDDGARVHEALEAGAAGFVVKMSPPSELVRAIRAVHRGEAFVDGSVASVLVARSRGRGPALSRREAEVLQLLADGHTTESAALQLFLSAATVRSYAEGAMQKLDARNRTHAAVQALRRGLIA